MESIFVLIPSKFSILFFALTSLLLPSTNMGIFSDLYLGTHVSYFTLLNLQKLVSYVVFSALPSRVLSFFINQPGSTNMNHRGRIRPDIKFTNMRMYSENSLHMIIHQLCLHFHLKMLTNSGLFLFN